MKRPKPVYRIRTNIGSHFRFGKANALREARIMRKREDVKGRIYISKVK